jgi:hypothetical protein
MWESRLRDVGSVKQLPKKFREDDVGSGGLIVIYY